MGSELFHNWLLTKANSFQKRKTATEKLQSTSQDRVSKPVSEEHAPGRAWTAQG
jgi:hypothetical protein